MYGTSSSSENEQKKSSPDGKLSSKTSPEPTPACKDDRVLRKLSPSSKEKRVSFEAEDKSKDSVEKDREDSLPPPDFEENYLIAQSDILRQASIEYDRRMQEHKEMLKKMKDEERFDESAPTEFPDFETWMEEREREESRKSSLEKAEGKPRSMADLRDEVLLEASVEGSFDSFEKQNEGEETLTEEKLLVEKPVNGIERITVKADIEPHPVQEEDEPDRRKRILTEIWNAILDHNLSESNESLKKPDWTFPQVEKEAADKRELIKQDSMKEMRRSLEKKWLEKTEKILFRKDSKSELRRRSEEKSPVTVKATSRQRRSLSFDEEILI